MTRSEDETERAGERLGAALQTGDVVGLTGELGAGKTAFARGLARGLGASRAVTSPTFVLVNHYRGRLPMFHVDAYRTDSLTEVLELGFEDYLSAGGVTVVEWADKVRPLMPPETIWVHVSGVGDEPREIAIERPESSGTNPRVPTAS